MNVEIKISSRKIPYKSSLKYLEKRVKKVKSDITENDIKLNMHIRKAEHVWECLISVVTPIHET